MSLNPMDIFLVTLVDPWQHLAPLLPFWSTHSDWAVSRISFYFSGHFSLYTVGSYSFINPLKGKHSARLLIFISYTFFLANLLQSLGFKKQSVFPIQTYLLIQSTYTLLYSFISFLMSHRHSAYLWRILLPLLYQICSFSYILYVHLWSYLRVSRVLSLLFFNNSSTQLSKALLRNNFNSFFSFTCLAPPN